jgi:hypothetical protein
VKKGGRLAGLRLVWKPVASRFTLITYRRAPRNGLLLSIFTPGHPRTLMSAPSMS